MEVKEVFVQCKIVLVTEVQSPWPSQLVKQLQERLRSRSTVVQETTVVMWLEPWQVKLMQSDEWVTETCAWFRSDRSMILKDIRVEVCDAITSGS